MIYLRLMGGMGNQMFQFAMARALCHRTGAELTIDASLMADNESVNSQGISLRTYALDVFGLEADLCEKQFGKKILFTRKQDRVKRFGATFFCKATNLFSDRWIAGIVERKKVGFDKSLLKLPRNVFLQGYFPSYRYFEDCQKLIRDEFSFRSKPDASNQQLMDFMASTNSVSLHVRRGDYISNQNTNDKFGVCSLGYYKKAIDYIEEKIENPRYFIFTNDLDYARENMEVDKSAVFVSGNTGHKSFEDMRLMSHCKHNIIANSSFSWWAAWLNNNPHKIVIAPSPVFDKLDIKDKDFFPAEWIKLPKYG